MNCPTSTGCRVQLPEPQFGRFIGQTMPHFEQFIGSKLRFASQPSFGSPLQSAKPALQEPSTQFPSVQPAIAFGSPLHERPHLPQLFGSPSTAVSQPLP